jgi:hypothetical protein
MYLSYINLELLTIAILVFLIIALKGLRRGKCERISVLRLQKVILYALNGRLVREISLVAHLAKIVLVWRLIEGYLSL